jgi:hypothetical protein
MKIPVLIEATSEDRYRATGLAPLADSAEGDTPEAAVEKLKEILRSRLANGARFSVIELPGEMNPWLSGAGVLRDDPLFEDWRQAMADYRREADQAEDAP